MPKLMTSAITHHVAALCYSTGTIIRWMVARKSADTARSEKKPVLGTGRV